MGFSKLQLSPQLLAAIGAEGYTIPTAIQQQAIPPILEGKDVLGSAQTGTGKTAAFAVPILHRLSIKTAPQNGQNARRARCLVLCPTRELASQIAESFRVYGKGLHLRQAVIFGGVGQTPQVQSLRAGVDIIVATPGRLMDLMEQRHVNLSAIEVLVLDEADRMLDMGFIHPIRQIVSKLPSQRQTLLFSATVPSEIRKLADSLMTKPVVVSIAPVASTVKIEESVYRVEKRDKPALLAHLVQSLKMYRTLVFTRTKHGADRVVKHLQTRGIRSEAIHGNKSQGARQRALSNFASNKIPVLVATDVASRGIDVDGITHVVNYDLTHEPDTYVHRIGRTGRAGASGSAVSFCDREEVANLKAIERLIRRTIPVHTNPLPSSPSEAYEKPEPRESGHANARSHSHGSAPARSHGSQHSQHSHAGAHTPSRSHSAPHSAGSAHASPRSAARSGPHPLHSSQGRHKPTGNRPAQHQRTPHRGRNAARRP